MVIFLNLDGTAQKVTPEHVYQGSNEVTDITVIAQYAAQTAMRIGFVLPNGLYWQMKQGGNYAPMQYVGGAENGQANAWTFTLPFSVTEQNGDVFAAVNAVEANGNKTSYMCRFTVEESVVPSDPPAPEKSVYDYLQEYLSILDGRTKNVPNLVASIQKVAPNAIVYISDSGIRSEKIVIEGGDAAPMPVGVASTIEIPSDAWQPVRGEDLAVTGYTVTVTAAQHAQMRDGATANDLWISFDETVDNVVTGAYQGYTVDEAGDITIKVNTPVAMTVRVWNGKGLVDAEARDSIAAETARAEAAEARLQRNIDAETQRATAEEADLQKQIDHIVDVGVDKFARAEIVKETARAKAAEDQLQSSIDAEKARAEAVEDQLQSNINAEKSRAEAAESALDGKIADNSSKIQTLQSDVAQIESYVPAATSTDNQLADKAFVNSSINNFAAFYITSNAQGDAFATRAALTTATTYYSGGKERVPTQNDYAIVLADESQPKGVDGNYPTTRHSYQGGTYPDGQWDFQYVVNNTSLTQAQVDAINSGITQSLVEQIETNKTAIEAEKTERGNADANLQAQITAIGASGVTGVKGNDESSYRTGQVNITSEDIGAVDKSGDTMTGPLTVTQLLSAIKDGTVQNRIIPLPLVPYSLIDSTHITDTYLKNLLKWICKNYPNLSDPLFIGIEQPNSVGSIIIHIYNTNNIDKYGLPQYATGLFLNIGGGVLVFGTSDYSWYYNNVITTAGGFTLHGTLNIDTGNLEDRGEPVYSPNNPPPLVTINDSTEISSGTTNKHLSDPGRYKIGFACYRATGGSLNVYLPAGGTYRYLTHVSNPYYNGNNNQYSWGDATTASGGTEILTITGNGKKTIASIIYTRIS